MMWRALFLILLSFGLLVRIDGLFRAKQGLSQDESVSYLCAAATQGQYEEDAGHFDGRLMTAGIVQAYYQGVRQWDPGRVARDLATYDIHPPLYFWMLHGLHVVIGHHPWNGALMNVLLSLVMLLVVHRLAREVLADRVQADLVALLWYLSPAVVPIDLEARHYQLFGLLATSSVLLGLRLLKEGSRPQLIVLFTLVNALGFLTHYYFGFTLVPWLFLGLVHFGNTRPFRTLFASMVISFGLFLVVFPGFLLTIQGYLDGRSVAVVSEDTLARSIGLVEGTLGFFTEWRWLRWLVSPVLLVGMALVLRRALRSSLPGKRAVRWILGVLAWDLFFTVVLYLARVSPGQAVGEQYFAYLWPLLSVVVIHYGVVLIGRSARRFVVPVVLLQASISLVFAVRHSPYAEAVLPQDWQQAISGSDVLVTDRVGRAWLPRTCALLPEALLLVVERPGGPTIPEDLSADRVAVLRRVSSKALKDGRCNELFPDLVVGRDHGERRGMELFILEHRDVLR